MQWIATAADPHPALVAPVLRRVDRHHERQRKRSARCSPAPRHEPVVAVRSGRRAPRRVASPAASMSRSCAPPTRRTGQVARPRGSRTRCTARRPALRPPAGPSRAVGHAARQHVDRDALAPRAPRRACARGAPARPRPPAGTPRRGSARDSPCRRPYLAREPADPRCAAAHAGVAATRRDAERIRCRSARARRAAASRPTPIRAPPSRRAPRPR